MAAADEEPSSPSDGKSLRIALLGYRGNPRSGGQGIFLYYLSKFLTLGGHQVTIISGAPYPRTPPGVQLIEVPGLDMTNRKNRLTAFRFHFLRESPWFWEWWQSMLGAFPDPEAFGKRALKILKERRDSFDVVHDNQTLCTSLIEIQKLLPTVTSFHHPLTADLQIKLDALKGFKERFGAKRWFGSYIRWQKKTAPHLQKVVFASKVSWDMALREYRINEDACALVPCGVDAKQFHPIPQIDKDKNRIISVLSADEPIKGGIHLVRALGLLGDRIPDVRLTLVCPLKKQGQVWQEIDKLGLRGRIDFYQDVDSEELIELYSQAAIAVVPTLYEGFGFPGVEAMACGLPVVSTTAGSLPEVLQNAALQVSPADAQALADAIFKVLSDDDLRLRLILDGRRLIGERYDWGQVAATWVDLYKEAIERYQRAHLGKSKDA